MNNTAQNKVRKKKKNIIPECTRKKVHSLRKLGLVMREISGILGITIHAVDNILVRESDNNTYMGTGL